MSEPIRILHVLGALDRGGAETMVMNLYRTIDRHRIQFDFVIHTNDHCHYTDEILNLGGKIYSVPRFKGKNILAYMREWNAFFRNHTNYKIIHGHIRSTASIYLKIAKKYGLVTIAHSHNTSSGTGVQAVIKNILQYPIRYIADYLFACTLTAGEWLYGQKVCQKKNFFVVKNAIDSRQYIFNQAIRERLREELGFKNKLVIGHAGRFHPQKNHVFLINIFKEIHAKNENSVLILIGEGECKKLIIKKVRDLGLSDSVIFMGVRSDVQDLLQAIDVFVLPSLYEGLGIVAIEAQAAGLPCIVADTVPIDTKVTGLIEYLSLGQSPKEWADKVLTFGNDENRLNTIDNIFNAGYDITQTVEWIQQFYKREWGHV